MERTIVTCEGCSNVYTARVREDGGVILPLDDQSCDCGSEAFDTVDSVGTEEIHA
ncbi:hypothetical protein [Halomarina litorea]|uniref:hypothetical protein n=1 Tax=Halomarina litorea TaxID=2961595 RepID=UPI0020C309C9|nr:hypothetical protein [Halomarina sp. BCD28]